MAAARKRSVPYDRQVFLNCPFDDDYYPLLRASVFTIQACGFTARIALENTGVSSNQPVHFRQQTAIDFT